MDRLKIMCMKKKSFGYKLTRFFGIARKPVNNVFIIGMKFWPFSKAMLSDTLENMEKVFENSPNFLRQAPKKRA